MTEEIENRYKQAKIETAKAGERMCELRLGVQRKQILKNIGQLRQWLNEDRITDLKKMVTNEEIKVWLK